MIRSFEKLSSKCYPGRGIILGRGRRGRNLVVVYFITGRSASSQARKFVWESQTLWTKPTNEETLKKGQPDLLIYPAAIVTLVGAAISNGKQTEDLARALQKGRPAAQVFEEGLKAWSYEPDAPIHTPRISACLFRDGRSGLHIIKRRPDGSEERRTFVFPSMKKGRGVLLTTYAGREGKLVPPFEGSPLEVCLSRSDSPQETVEDVYAALRPGRGKKDFRVAAACVFMEQDSGREVEVAIINRMERMEAHHG